MQRSPWPGSYPAEAAAAVRDAAAAGFFDGLQAGFLVAGGVALSGAMVAALALPARPPATPERDAAPHVASARVATPEGRL